MDLFKDLMNVNKPLQKICVPTGQVDGNIVIEDESFSSDDEEYMHLEKNKSNTYAKEYLDKELMLYAKLRSKKESDLMSNVEVVEDLLSSMGRVEVHQLEEEEIKEVYRKYRFDKQSEYLNIDDYRSEILSLLAVNPVVIVQGPTGCGKTTRVPQFILDECRMQDKPCKIVVTQPRRIAAISVAKRVCEERAWPLGEVCGYQVGLEKQTGFNTLLTYVTTGVLLQKLVKEKNLNDYTHIIIDEVHERNQDMDFLLLLVRRFLNTNSYNTKVLLMSATLDTDEFADYFMNAHDTQMLPPPVLNINKPSRYSVQKFYIDQLQKSAPAFNISEPKIDPSLYTLFTGLVRTFDKLDQIDPITKETKIGHVLVFLPGILEIEEAHDSLMNSSQKVGEDKQTPTVGWLIHPLHSSITTEEQRKVFFPPPSGVRKIILSTNIAESSITVPDITYVIDFCLTKTMVLDPDTQYQSLQLQWASHVNCTQRAGRVGRVSDGRVYRFVPTQFFDLYLPKSVEPEILRAPLNHVVLASKLLDIKEPPKAILALAMNPPALDSIDSTVLYLKEIGALTVCQDGKKVMNDGDLTFMGEVIAMLPLDVHLSKFIFLGHIFSCLEAAIIMATGCSISIFKTPFKERLKAYTNRLQWADGSASDIVAYLHLYNVWQRRKRLHPNPKAEKLWCEKNFVAQRALNEWHILVKEIQSRLARMNIQPEEGPGNVVHSETELPILIKVVMCGAFYPNYFKRSVDAGQIDEREAVKTIGGRDPFKTIYFTGFDHKQPGPLYANSIKAILKDCATDMHVSFDNSSKVYVEFMTPKQFETVMIDGQRFVTTMPGKIRTEVYRAVRQRQLQLTHRIAVMSSDKAWAIAKSVGIQPLGSTRRSLPSLERVSSILEDDSVVQFSPIVPTLDMTFLILRISHRVDAGHFWAHLCSNGSTLSPLLPAIYEELNKETVQLQPLGKTMPVIDTVYAAKFSDDDQFYRCKVISLNSFGKKQASLAQVLYIDFGNTEFVDTANLFYLPDTPLMSCPAQAVECHLSEIQPSMVLNPRALWSEEAVRKFDMRTADKMLAAKIYSVVNEVVHLELYATNVTSMSDFTRSENYWLINEGYAEPAEESFLSKENHNKRLLCAEHPEHFASLPEEVCQPQNSVNYHLPSNSCSSSLTLKGPYSPLEMQIFSVTASGMNKTITIEGSSVNAVLLDTDPQDPHERLIVAAHIGQNPSGTMLNLRHTTVMPNIHGFPMLMSLLFCPSMEPKPTADGTQIGAILCGVGGYDNTHRSMFPPHDICLTLDTELTESDLNEINQLRQWMNHAVKVMEFCCRGIPSSSSMALCQREIKEQLLKILKMKRKNIERVYVRHSSVWGQTLYDSAILRANTQNNSSQIWPLHWSVKLNPNKEEAALDNNIREMEEVALGMRTVNEMNCMKCNFFCTSVGEMRIHLSSSAHKDAGMKYEQRPRM
ncbi:probable ATP-dependent RNA helicase spindle-E isoform X2 [Photinus pyralis]|uniref:probable ATP-dependent RNA helicase spindle-E isoform X2 n=1 Tax=Photinus pyralis TaxID=7054 RepID=UPI0012677A82|nr:probable ATP-dependent RNA helicase spindle-E isoform X2 [Photinus pyralis]